LATSAKVEAEFTGELGDVPEAHRKLQLILSSAALSKTPPCVAEDLLDLVSDFTGLTAQTRVG